MFPKYLVGMQGGDIDILSYDLEGKAITFLWHAEILVAAKNARPPKYFIPQSPL